MSDDSSNPAENWDPLTSPYWQPNENVDEAMEIQKEKILDEAPTTSQNIPQPPDVDQILRGEYTGWVPLIKPNDSIESATARFEVDNAKRETQKIKSFDEVFESSQQSEDANALTKEDISEIKDLIREMKSEPQVFVKDFYPNFRDIAQNPDTVSSPAQALEEARRRIEQMRANLQVNLSRVQQSFDHPIFEPETFVEEKSVEEAILEEVFQPSEIAEAERNFEETAFADREFIEQDAHEQDAHEQDAHEQDAHEQELFDSNTSEPIFEQTRVSEQVYEQPQEVQATTTVINNEPVKEDHSLELVIMRDEIKDLRDRLDSSQRLIESLMERLANLAELALTNRRD